MKIDNTDEINELIHELDTFLYQGYLLKTHTIDDWNVKSKQEENKPDIEQYKIDFEKQINDWLNQVASLLFSRFKERHLYFHFIHPKLGLSFSFSHPLGNLTHALGNHLFTLEDIIIRLEERRNLSIRQEIAEKEYQADILYSISYSDHSREIKLNNIVLKKPDFNSENDNCFHFIYKNSGRPIGIEELEQAVGEKLKKRLAHVVRDLGFVSELKDIFFPVVTKNEVMFVNPITKQYSDKHSLPPINFSKIGRQSKPE